MVRHPERDPYDPPNPPFAPHSDPDFPGFAVWDPIEPPSWEDDGTQQDRKPRLFAAKFESSSHEAERFLHDPLSLLREAGIDVPDGAYVTTQVINHHRRLDARIIRAAAVIDDESVGFIVHKEDAG